MQRAVNLLVERTITIELDHDGPIKLVKSGSLQVPWTGLDSGGLRSGGSVASATLAHLEGTKVLTHGSMGVKDIASSRRFYDAAMKLLGYKCLFESPKSCGYGVTAPALWLHADQRPVAADDESGLHFCFNAAKRADVDAFHAAALKAGGRDRGKPGSRRNYGDKYSAGFIVDPEGYRLEACCTSPQ